MGHDPTRAVALTTAARAAQRPQPPEASPGLPVSALSWPAKHDTPSDRCIRSSRSHVRKHGSQAHRGHVVVGAGGVLPAVPDALDTRALTPCRVGAEQLARDPHLPPQARGERSERWRSREASDAARGHGRGARRRTSDGPTTLRRARPRRAVLSAGPRRDPASRRAHRAVSGADGLGQITCCAGRAARAVATISPRLSSRVSRPTARQYDGTCRASIWGAGGALGAAHLASGGLCRQLHHSPAQFVTCERVSSMSTWPAEMATWPAQRGRFRPFLRT